jgi:TatD DNase family protein
MQNVSSLPEIVPDSAPESLGSPIESPPVSPLELVDSHAHIDVPEFDGDRAEMLSRARAAGVRCILAIGGGIAETASDVASSSGNGESAHGDAAATGDGESAAADAAASSSGNGESRRGDAGPRAASGRLASALPFAERYDWIYAAAGIHPHEAALAAPAHYDTLSRLATHPRFLAWGEIGLDYHYDHSPRDVQQRVFVEQLELARAVRRPIILHCRDAWSDCLGLLELHWRSAGLGGILHCFTGTLADAMRGIEMGFLVSFAGNVTYPKAQNLREVAGALPLASLLIETDSPFLAPQPYRGRRNEPAYVAEVARTLGPVRNLPPAEVASATANNFRRFFGLNGMLPSP